MPIWATAGSACGMEASVTEDWRREGDPLQRVFWGVPPLSLDRHYHSLAGPPKRSLRRESARSSVR